MELPPLLPLAILDTYHEMTLIMLLVHALCDLLRRKSMQIMTKKIYEYFPSLCITLYDISTKLNLIKNILFTYTRFR